MKLLLDTHIVLWAAFEPERLPRIARDDLRDTENELFFSAASIWEVAIKAARYRKDFGYDPSLLRRGLLQNGYVEIGILGTHTAEVVHLPRLHDDPFDRLLLAQARYEGMVLLTADRRLAEYGPPVRLA